MQLAVPFYRQTFDYTCGPAVLLMLLEYFGIKRSEAALARAAHTTTEGTSVSNIRRVLREHGIQSRVSAQATWKDIQMHLKNDMPVLVHYKEPEDDEGHYAVVIGYEPGTVLLNDSYHGEAFRIPLKHFQERWIGYMNTYKDRGWMLVPIPPKK